jgi:hypothetical protein
MKHGQVKVWLIASTIVVVGFVGFLAISSGNNRQGGDGACNNNYSGSCVPNVTYDLDCSRINSSVTVIGKDVYHFDADNDNLGCESYEQ